MDKIRKRQFTFSSAYLVLALAAFWGLHVLLTELHEPRRVTYSVFLNELDAGHIQRVSLHEDESIAALKPGPATAATHERNPKDKAGQVIVTGRLPGIDETALLATLAIGSSHSSAIAGFGVHEEREQNTQSVVGRDGWASMAGGGQAAEA